MKKKIVKKIVKPIKVGKKKEPVVEPIADVPEVPVVPEVKKVIYAGKEVMKVEDFQDEQGLQKKVYLSDGSIEVVEPKDYEARISEE
jgi:hypothetical protein